MAQTDASQSVNSTSGSGTTDDQRDEAARALTSKLGEEASTLGSDTKQLAKNFAQEAGGTAKAKLTSGKEQAARGIASVAEALRSSGEQLRSEEQEALPKYVDGAADKLEKASDYLRDTDLSEVVEDVESFARREPLLFVGGAFALGLIGGRFLKSSQRRTRPELAAPPSSSGGAAFNASSRQPYMAQPTRSQGGARPTAASQPESSPTATSPSDTGLGSA